MANFYGDNDDIRFSFKTLDLATVATLQELGFREKDEYDYAPKDAEDAVDSYDRVLDVVGEIAGDFIAPRSEDIDREGNVLENGKVRYATGIRESLDMLAKADLMGFTLPRKYGGLNFPNIIYTMAIEIVSRADASIMNIFGLQGIAETINMFASDELKAKYLPRFAAGEITGAMALTEPDAGSDLQNVKLKATEADDGSWRLNGVKRFITNGCGDVLLVLARSEPDREGGMGLSFFLCEGGPKVKVRRLEDKLGIHGSPTCELQFNDAPAWIVGERRRGLVYGMALMNGARIGIAAQALGIAQAAFNEARAYAYSRQQFGKPIEQIPAVADMLTDMRVLIEAARALTYDASCAVDTEVGLYRKDETGIYLPGDDPKAVKKELRSYKRLAAMLTPMCKYYATEIANKVASDAIQVLGGSGYMRDYPVERYFRDARITNIYEGTSQLQVVAIIGGILSGVAEKYFAQLAEKVAPGYQPLGNKLASARELLAKATETAKNAHSERKAVIADRFITHAIPRITMNFEQVMSGEKSTLEHFDAIVGPVIE